MNKALVALFLLTLLSLGYWQWSESSQKPGADAVAVSDPVANSAASTSSSSPRAAVALKAEGVIPTLERPVALLGATPFVPSDNVVVIELSEYAGYAGLLLANGGTEPSEDSAFFRKHGFKVKITLTEEESWSVLNSGEVAAAASTVDVLAVYADQLQVTVPLQIAYSRGADGIVTHERIRRINDLRGETLMASQFSESDFFLRYLAQEAELPVHALTEGEAPRRDAVNLRYAEDPFVAGDVFAEASDALGGFVGWEPKVSEVAAAVPGAHILVTNRNLLVIADILMFNRGFAQAHPEKVQAIVEETIRAHAAIRENSAPAEVILADVFGWTRAEAREELDKVHLSNWPENQAFFEGGAASAGSFRSIFQTSLFAYADFVKHTVGPDRFIDTSALNGVAGSFTGQVADIRPLRSSSREPVESNPLLARNIRFYFEPNSADLSQSEENEGFYRHIVQMLAVSPGSTVLLRGHVDNSRVAEFQAAGGENFLRRQALGAIDLSNRRAEAVRQHLIKAFAVTADRIEIVGRGWEEPLDDFDSSRRVEVEIHDFGKIAKSSVLAGLSGIARPLKPLKTPFLRRQGAAKGAAKRAHGFWGFWREAKALRARAEKKFNFFLGGPCPALRWDINPLCQRIAQEIMTKFRTINGRGKFVVPTRRAAK